MTSPLFIPYQRTHYSILQHEYTSKPKYYRAAPFWDSKLQVRLVSVSPRSAESISSRSSRYPGLLPEPPLPTSGLLTCPH